MIDPPAGRQRLRGRRVLVTAGPTWVRIDAVRHLSNFATGETGLVISRALAAAGAEVTLLLGPGRTASARAGSTQVEVVDFVTFDDLHTAVRERIGSREYDAMVHTAAVSDFTPVREEPGKIPSDREELVLRLRRTPKIVDEVKQLDPAILLVKFKLEVGREPDELLRIAEASRHRSKADLLVANDAAAFSGSIRPAVIVDASGLLRRTSTQEELAEALVDLLCERLRGPGRADVEGSGPIRRA